MCYQTIVKNAERIGAEAFIGLFSYAGMPAAEAQTNLRTFAQTVMPRLQARTVTGNIGWAA